MVGEIEGFLYTPGKSKAVLQGVVFSDHIQMVNERLNFLFPEEGFYISSCRSQDKHDMTHLKAGNKDYYKIFKDCVHRETKLGHIQLCDSDDSKLAQDLKIEYDQWLENQARRQLQDLTIKP